MIEYIELRDKVKILEAKVIDLEKKIDGLTIELEVVTNIIKSYIA